MSVHFASVAWAVTMDIEHAPKIILVKLSDSANDDGVCWPSHKRLAKELIYARSTVNDWLAWLESAGLITREPGGPGRNTRYQLHMDAMRARVEPDHWIHRKAAYTADRATPPAGVTTPPAGAPIHRQAGTNHNKIINNHQLAADKPPRARDLVFEALVKINGSELESLSKPERGRINAAAMHIRAAAPAMKPEALAREIRLRAEAYHESMPPRSLLTASALAANWSRLGAIQRSLFEPEKKAAIPSPDWDWKAILREMFDDPVVPATWGELPPCVRREAEEFWQQKNGAPTYEAAGASENLPTTKKAETQDHD